MSLLVKGEEVKNKGLFHKRVQFRYGTRKQLNELMMTNKNLEKVDIYLDTEQGIFYIIPAEKNELEMIFDSDFKNIFENDIKI